ncbi:MAG: hypothetical protein ABUS48_02220 [Pseudomonadota bacterium]
MRFFGSVAAAAVLIVALNSCAPGDFTYWKRVDGPYRISAIDDINDMNICYDAGGGGCYERIEATVFSVGWDTHYIVAARRVRNTRGAPLYYYIDRTSDVRSNDTKAVHGPFSEAEFRVESRRLSLPPMKRYVPFEYCSGRPLCSPLSDALK